MKKTENKRTMDIPPILEPLIKLVRTIPFNKEFPKVKNDFLNFELQTYDDVEKIDVLVLEEIMKDSLSQWVADFQNSLPENFENSVREDLKNLCKYIWDEDHIPEYPVFDEIRQILEIEAGRSIYKFLDFRQIWGQFKILTQIVNEILENKGSLSVDEISRKFNQIPIYPEYRFKKSDETVSIKFSDQFTAAINGIEITRIRECKWCHKVFWAGKKNQNVCPSIDDKTDSQSNKKSYDCGYFYNIKNFGIRGKKKKREEWLEKLQEEYKNQKVWAWKINFTYSDLKSYLPKQKELNGIPIKITDILLSRSQTETTYKFIATELHSKRDGFIEFKYNSRLKDNIERVLRFK